MKRMKTFSLTKEELKILKKLDTPKKIQDFLNKLKIHGKKPLLVDLKTTKDDFEHVIAVFKQGKGKNSKWGAITKTNHAVLRYRESIYNSIRELVMSFFHEYFDDKGRKNLRSFSMPINLNKFGSKW